MTLPAVIAGFDPAIHLLEVICLEMDARVKPAHDGDILAFLKMPACRC
jgi:hypothetical protein